MAYKSERIGCQKIEFFWGLEASFGSWFQKVPGGHRWTIWFFFVFVAFVCFVAVSFGWSGLGFCHWFVLGLF